MSNVTGQIVPLGSPVSPKVTSKMAWEIAVKVTRIARAAAWTVTVVEEGLLKV